jgi:hypothetical protein
MNAQTSEAANRRAFDAWRDRFFAHYYAARPVNATFIGVHDHDDALPDFSPSALASHTAQMRELREELALIPQDGLDAAQRHDSLLADGFLELQLLEDTLPQFHRGNPAVYTGEGVFAILSLFLRDAEPFSDRVRSATARMRSLPEFLAQARANVQSAPPAWTDQAIREARSAASYFAEGLPRLAAERGIGDPPFHEAATIAHDAFVEHARWLDESLRQRPEQEVACGRDAFDRYLRRGHFLPTEQDSSWLADYANRALTRTREALDERAAQLDPTRTWQEQLAELADHHPSADRYYRIATIGRSATSGIRRAQPPSTPICSPGPTTRSTTFPCRRPIAKPPRGSTISPIAAQRPLAGRRSTATSCHPFRRMTNRRSSTSACG